jgi:hypothetical protein
MALTKKAQEVVEYLSKQREILLASAEGVSEAQLNFKPAADQWSIKEIFHHLWIVEGATAKLMSIMLKQAVENNLTEETDPEGSVMIGLESLEEALSKKFQAPERFVPIDAVSLEESISKLGETRIKLTDPLEQLCRYDVTQLTYPHPAVGPLDTYQWVMVMGSHEGRHTRQINRVKEDANYPAN